MLDGKYLKEKSEIKKRMLGKPTVADLNQKPLFAIFLEKNLSKLQIEVIGEVCEALKSLDQNLIYISEKNLFKNDGKNIYHLTYSMSNRKALLDSADIAIVFDFNDIEELLLNGIVPVSIEQDALQNYNPNYETGNSFTYKNFNKWEIFAALVRAMEAYKFPFDWRNIIKKQQKKLP